MTVELSLSVRERIRPGTIERVTGRIEYCELCAMPYRRMATEGRLICGPCWPATIAPEPECA